MTIDKRAAATSSVMTWARRIAVVAVLSASTCLFQTGALGEQAGGVITGRVTVDDVPERMMVEVTADQAVCGDAVEDRAAVVDASGGVANVVIIVAGAPWVEDPPNPIVNNKDCYFEPRVQVAKTGSIVSLQSDDNALHTTHAYDDQAQTLFNVAIPFPGITVDRPLLRPGVVRVECDSHGWMRGWVRVSDDTGVVSGPDGSFEITGVPPGTYELTIWHERFEGIPQSVTVTAGGTVEANFTVQ